MTPEQLKAFGKAAKELMSDPNRKDPVDPFRQPLYPAPARSLEEVHEGMRKHRIKVMMLEYPTMTRARAAELVALDLPDRTPKPLPVPQRPVIPPPPMKSLDQEFEEIVNNLMHCHPTLTREEAEDHVENFF
jgi:hypothetical protein